MTTVAEQVQYESSVRLRYAVIAFCAALLIVASALVQLSIPQPNSEMTTVLEIYSHHGLANIAGSVLELFGFIAVAGALYWLHRVAQARRPESRDLVRWSVAVGALIAGVIAVVDTIEITHISHVFMASGNQGYPQAHQLTSHSTLLNLLPILGFLGTAVLAIGVLLTSLTALRVGLVARPVGYAGVLAGLLFFLSGFGFIGLVIQAFWLAALAVTFAGRWPAGDPPAWKAGVAMPWPPRAPAQNQQSRPARGQRRRVSDKDVLAAVEQKEAPPNPRAGRSKRKKRR